MVIASDAPVSVATRFNTQNLRVQTLLFCCLETGFGTTAPASDSYIHLTPPTTLRGHIYVDTAVPLTTTKHTAHTTTQNSPTS